jgi:ribosomal protein S18 acetylase RimI-like enzyme
VLKIESPVGVRYLDLVTTLLQRRRLADPDGGIWEAADLQWWWPRHRHDDPADARVWLDGGEPVAATVFTQWNPRRVGCDVLADADFEPAWTFAAQRCAEVDAARIELAVPETDPAAAHAARHAGFAPSDESYAVSWLRPADRRAPRHPLTDGYRIVARADDAARPHPMIGRNGVHVEDGLRQCSLYDPGLDLHVVAPNGTIAGYALFWPDLVTGVGLVEPMRVEDAHAGRGLGRHLLDAGLRGLAARGCARLKVSMEPANTAAVRLYTGAGFVVSRHDRTWLWEMGRMMA